MKNIILADYNHPLVQEKAKQLTDDSVGQRENIRRIFEYVRDGVQFAFPPQGDLVKASQTIQTGVGQCNTKSTLFLALCKAAKIPARIHFSTIRKEIQRGLFTGIAYRLMPDAISHSWIEVLVDGTWRRIDSFINDMKFYTAGKNRLKTLNWDTGFSISCSKGNSSADLNLEEERFVQMDAVLDDHGVWDEPMDYFTSSLYKNRPGFLKLIMYRLLVPRINQKVVTLRNDCEATGSQEKDLI